MANFLLSTQFSFFAMVLCLLAGQTTIKVSPVSEDFKSSDVVIKAMWVKTPLPSHRPWVILPNFPWVLHTTVDCTNLLPSTSVFCLARCLRSPMNFTLTDKHCLFGPPTLSHRPWLTFSTSKWTTFTNPQLYNILPELPLPVLSCSQLNHDTLYLCAYGLHILTWVEYLPISYRPWYSDSRCHGQLSIVSNISLPNTHFLLNINICPLISLNMPLVLHLESSAAFRFPKYITQNLLCLLLTRNNNTLLLSTICPCVISTLTHHNRTIPHPSIPLPCSFLLTTDQISSLSSHIVNRSTTRPSNVLEPNTHPLNPANRALLPIAQLPEILHSTAHSMCIQSSHTDNQTLQMVKHVKNSITFHLLLKNKKLFTSIARTHTTFRPPQLTPSPLYTSEPDFHWNPSLPARRTQFTTLLWNNLAGALTFCTILAHYPFQNYLCVLLPNHNSNKINVPQISVRFTLSAYIKTNSAIGRPIKTTKFLNTNFNNTNHLISTWTTQPHLQDHPHRLHRRLPPHRAGISSALLFLTSSSHAFGLAHGMNARHFTSLPSRVLFSNCSLGSRPLSTSWDHYNPFLTQSPLPLTVVNPHANILGCPCLPFPLSVVNPCEPFGRIPFASLLGELPLLWLPATSLSFCLSLGTSSHHSSTCHVVISLNPLHTWALYPLLIQPHQLHLLSVNQMNQSEAHPLPQSLATRTHFNQKTIRASSFAIHTNSFQKIRARKLAHSLSPSCQNFILTSCSLGLQPHPQHMQWELCQCPIPTTTSCSAHCTSAKLHSSPIPACAVPAWPLSLPPTPITHTRTVISPQSAACVCTTSAACVCSTYSTCVCSTSAAGVYSTSVACVCTTSTASMCSTSAACVCSTYAAYVCSTSAACVYSTSAACVCNISAACVCSTSAACVCSTSAACVCPTSAACVCSTSAACVCSISAASMYSTSAACVCSTLLPV